MIMEAEKKPVEQTMDIEKPNYMLMSLQRILVIFVILAGVIVVVYYTPMPEEYFENCDRECHELDWPMICRVKLVVEVYKTLSKSCGNCAENGEQCPPMCISGDGRERGVLSVNRELPAPAFHVCHNDILVVDVVHRAPAHALSIHWRGQPQKETPFMDGAPMLTQCPQPAYTTFQYKFRASEVGTHMYHAHSAADAADGVAGAFIVRQSPRVDPLRKLYDVDATEHTIFVSEWGHSMGPLAGLTSHSLNAESLLINGKGNTEASPDAPLTRYSVSHGKRYRFRLLYSGGTKSCPIKFSIDEHTLTLVALDGHTIKPEEVDSIALGRGERADFIMEAKRISSAYKIKVVAEKWCQDSLEGEALLVYDSQDSKVLHRDEDTVSKVHREFSSVTSDRCKLAGVVCLDEVQASERLSPSLAGAVDRTIYVPFNYSTRQISTKRVDESFALRVLVKSMDAEPVPIEGHQTWNDLEPTKCGKGSCKRMCGVDLSIQSSLFESWGQTDGHRFTYPASPLLTQGSDVALNTLCPEDSGQGEECVHVKSVPLHATVEIIMFDQGGESDHIFHLHGYSFRVVAIRQLDTNHTKDEIISLNEQGNLFTNRNLIDPVIKDTIVIPKFGVVALRLKADNPGYWLMRDERSAHWTRGLDFILKVGEDSDFVQAPADFPKCGSYVGPEYFLI